MIIRPIALAVTVSTALAGAPAHVAVHGATHEPVALRSYAPDSPTDGKRLVPTLIAADVANRAPPVSAIRQFAKGRIVIGDPWARQTAPGQTTGGAFLTITNKGDVGDKLIGASSPAATRVELHSMSMAGGVMRMRPVTRGLDVPAGGTLMLSPEGYHIMFVGLKAVLTPGKMIPATLIFARAGRVEVRFKVEPVTFGGHHHG